MSEESVDGEFRDDVLGTEECVDLCACQSVHCRVVIHNQHIFQDECGEWLEVNFFKTDFALELVGKVVYHLIGNCCLHLWELYRD